MSSSRCPGSAQEASYGREWSKSALQIGPQHQDRRCGECACAYGSLVVIRSLSFSSYPPGYRGGFCDIDGWQSLHCRCHRRYVSGLCPVVTPSDCLFHLGADGIRSRLRAAVVGPELQPSPSHHSAYRMLVPADKIRAHEDLMALRLLEGAITMVDGGDRRIITYPCRNSTMLNFVCCLRECVGGVGGGGEERG